MALGIYFPLEDMSKEQYEQTHAKLEEAGAGSPKGRSFHCGFSTDGKIQVFDVWESQEDFDAFGEVLIPILQEAGVTPPEPMIAEVVRVID